ncbi:MAG: glycosyltransferase family 39 protein [Thermoanaerobaculia bacterium]
MTVDGRPSAEARARRMPPERLVPLFFLLLGAFGTVPVVRSLYVADLNWCYPYVSSDGFDWINNGLYWAGAPLLPSYRPPGLPLLMALLVKLDALHVLPFLNFVALALTACLLFAFLRERFSPLVSALTAWVFYANDFSQDLAKYVFAEVYATLLLVLAALLFLRAARRPIRYLSSGLVLGLSFLFHYAALPAGIGFAIAVLCCRREHLRLRPLWLGAAAATLIALGWMAARSLYYRSHPGVPAHLALELVAFVPQNVLFYVVAGTALVGLVAAPLYILGAFRTFQPADENVKAFQVSFLAPLVGLGTFFLFFYRWIDKRFLFYELPFLMVFFAGGADRLIDYGRRVRSLRAAIGAYLAVAVLWTQIRYPSYGIRVLALSPRDFLEFQTEGVARWTRLRLSGARVVRLNESLRASLSGGLFDFSLRSRACSLDTPEYAALLQLKTDLDERLGPGVPVALTPLSGWPADPWLCWNRLGNVIRRPVVRPGRAPCRVTDRETEGETKEEALLLRSGPFRVVCPM